MMTPRSQAGRAFFEAVIRDHLDIGRPDQVVLVFNRKLTPRTPGRFRTKIVKRGVNPQLSTYKSCRLKQYFKLSVALRTEVVIGDTYDFKPSPGSQPSPGQFRVVRCRLAHNVRNPLESLFDFLRAYKRRSQ